MILAAAAMIILGGATLLVLFVSDLLKSYEDSEAGCCQLYESESDEQ